MPIITVQFIEDVVATPEQKRQLIIELTNKFCRDSRRCRTPVRVLHYQRDTAAGMGDRRCADARSRVPDKPEARRSD